MRHEPTKAVCDRCGHYYSLPELRMQTVEGVRTNLLVCPKCLDDDWTRKPTPVEDTVVKNPRPDNTVRYLVGYDPIPPVEISMRFGKVWLSNE